MRSFGHDKDTITPAKTYRQAWPCVGVEAELEHLPKVRGVCRVHEVDALRWVDELGGSEWQRTGDDEDEPQMMDGRMQMGMGQHVL
jgi:hypothetical protein